MPKKLIKADLRRDIVINEGEFEAGDGDIMMKKTIRNYGTDGEEVPKAVTIENTTLLHKLFNEQTKQIYGKKYAERKEEPSMFEILSGGLEKPVENDYIKSFVKRGDVQQAKKNLQDNEDAPSYKQQQLLEDKYKKDVNFRINKAESNFVSETQDNYRNFTLDKLARLSYISSNPVRNKGKQPIPFENWMDTTYRIHYQGRSTSPHKDAGDDGIGGKLLENIQLNNEESNEPQTKSKDKSTKNKSAARANKTKNGAKSSKDLTNNKENKHANVKSKVNDKKDDKNKPQKSWKEKALEKSSVEHRQERIEDLHRWARWLPDSAYQSYFGKPAFHAYGKGNTNPTVGGHIYGHYMLSHNVNPEHGQNNPKYQQVYKAALAHGFVNGDRVPVLSRKRRENLEITPADLEYKMKMNPIMPPKFVEPAPESEYEEVPESAYKFEKKAPKKVPQKEKINFHPQKDEIKIDDDHNDEDYDDNEEEDQEVAKIVKGIPNQQPVGATPGAIDGQSLTPTPEPGTLEYRRMLEQFLNNPEQIKLVMQNGGDLQNIFPFCLVHNSYGKQLPVHELDPKNYKYLPAGYTQRIAPAGKHSRKGDDLYSVIMPEY